jgi:hypothetical protein
MRLFIFLFAISLFILLGCKTKQKTMSVNIVDVTPSGTTLGKVSHQYREGGCSTVILVNLENQDKPLTLIPRDTLAPEFDIDGLVILFNYRTLKMPNPKGCSVGIPAEITDISKK